MSLLYIMSGNRQERQVGHKNKSPNKNTRKFALNTVFVKPRKPKNYGTGGTGGTSGTSGTGGSPLSISPSRGEDGCAKESYEWRESHE